MKNKLGEKPYKNQEYNFPNRFKRALLFISSYREIKLCVNFIIRATV